MGADPGIGRGAVQRWPVSFPVVQDCPTGSGISLSFWLSLEKLQMILIVSGALGGGDVLPFLLLLAWTPGRRREAIF